MSAPGRPKRESPPWGEASEARFGGSLSAVCVFGAGAIGSFLAVHLAQCKANRVAVIARGGQLDAIRARGMQLFVGEQQLSARPQATGDCRTLDRQDVVFVTLKSHSLVAAAGDLAHLAASGATLVFVGNGIPWWYRLDRDAPSSPEMAAAIDPASLTRCIEPAQVVGCVAYSPNTVIEPGVSRCASASSRFLLGPAHASAATACEQVSTLLQAAGITVPPGRDIRREVWQKLLLNAAMSPVAALTGGNNQQVARDAELQGICTALCNEVVNVARADGIELRFDSAMLDPDRLPPHKPSMLQDMERGVPLETGSILDALRALARSSDVPVPTLDLVTALVSARASFRA